uniref:Salp20-like protein 2 n=1 Tax=Ixodes scapularis TaxID=6945 RepID=A7LFI2_IXOSC|nr:Salp20-like protein 2 [Ixodes scapularis]
MRTVLTCALLAILFLGSPCSSSEDGGEQGSRVETTTHSLYERQYRNHSGLCGAQYRNSSYAEPVYNCTLKALPPIVNKTWEGIRHNIRKTIPQFVSLMCNFTVVMPESFYLLYMGEATSNSEEEEESTGTTEESTAVKVTGQLITEAENACTANITGWTPPTTPEPTKSLEPVAVP